jgi:hypothetical protein
MTLLFEELRQKIEKQAAVYIQTGGKVARASSGTHIHGAIFDELVEYKPDPSDPVFVHGDTNTGSPKRNDGRTKNKKQDEPGYVALTKKKRR